MKTVCRHPPPANQRSGATIRQGCNRDAGETSATCWLPHRLPRNLKSPCVRAWRFSGKVTDTPPSSTLRPRIPGTSGPGPQGMGSNNPTRLVSRHQRDRSSCRPTSDPSHQASPRRRPMWSIRRREIWGSRGPDEGKPTANVAPGKTQRCKALCAGNKARPIAR